MKRGSVDTKTQLNMLFDKVWNKVLTQDYKLHERSLPSEHLILESWRIVQHRLHVKLTNSE